MGLRHTVLHTAPVVLGLLSASCRSASKDPSGASPTSEQRVEIAPSPVASSTPNDEADASAGQALAELFAHPAWEDLRTVWHLMDTYRLANPDMVGRKIPADKEAEMRQTLLRSTAQLEAVAPDRACIRLINQALMARIHALSGKNEQLMMMHRAPMPTEVQRSNAAQHLEARAQTLVRLRSEGKLHSDAWQAALDSLREEIAMLVVLEALPWDLQGLGRSDTSVPGLRAAVQRNCDNAKAADAGAQACEQALRKIDEAMSDVARLRGVIDAMITNLGQ